MSDNRELSNKSQAPTPGGFDSRMTVLHLGKFYPPHPGGMETHLHDLAVRQTGAARVSVIVANSTRQSESSVIEGVRVSRTAKIASVASMPICPGLVTAIRNSPADLVHIHMPNPGAAFAYLMSGHKGKLIITHNADTLGRKVLRQLSDPFVRRVMHRASRIIATSTRYLCSSPELEQFRDKCRIVPLGIECLMPPRVHSDTVRRLNAEFGERLILSVGRLVAYKGFDVLIRAMRHVDAKLILVGTGPDSAMLSKLSASEGVDHKVTMLGHVDDIAPYFAAASIFAFPSLNRAEAFGIVQLEAMAAGLPVVNTDIDSAVPEVCIDGKTGLTVQPGDTIALADALKLLLDRRDLREQFGKAARARVNTEYTARLMAERTLSLYSEVLSAN